VRDRGGFERVGSALRRWDGRICRWSGGDGGSWEFSGGTGARIVRRPMSTDGTDARRMRW
jgi:hypothetical protein